MNGFRWDRATSLYLIAPLVRVLRLKQKPCLPILMYHRIAVADEKRMSPYYRLCTAPRVFEQQMRLLAENDWQAMDLETALQSVDSRKKLVAITFDDGYRDVLTNAFPVLERFGFSATIFLPTAMIGDSRRTFKGADCLTWREVSELRRRGIRFGSHTVNHPVLYRLKFSDIQEELRASKGTIEEALQEPICSFAYPYAFPSADRSFVDRFVGLLQKTGYTCAVTTAIGRVGHMADLFTLPRLPVNSCDDETLLLSKLHGSYDWLAGVQNVIKACKHRFAGGDRN